MTDKIIRIFMIVLIMAAGLGIGTAVGVNVDGDIITWTYNYITLADIDFDYGVSYEEVTEALGEPNGFYESDPNKPYYNMAGKSYVVLEFVDGLGLYDVYAYDGVGGVYRRTIWKDEYVQYWQELLYSE